MVRSSPIKCLNIVPKFGTSLDAAEPAAVAPALFGFEDENAMFKKRLRRIMRGEVVCGVCVVLQVQ